MRSRDSGWRRAVAALDYLRWRRIKPLLRDQWGLLALVAIVVAVGLALIPSSFGRLPDLGLSASTRADLGAGLVGGAVVGLVFAIGSGAQQRSMREHRVRTAKSKLAAETDAILRTLLGGASLALSEAHRNAQYPRALLTSTAEARWTEGAVQVVCLRSGFLNAVMRPTTSVEDARIYLAALDLVTHIWDGLVPPAERVLDRGVPAIELEVGRGLDAARRGLEVREEEGLTDHQLETLVKVLSSMAEAIPPGRSASAAAARLISAWHGETITAWGALTGASPAGYTRDDPWIEHPDLAEYWMDIAASHLAASGDPSYLLPSEPMESIPFGISIDVVALTEPWTDSAGGDQFPK
jgi:hypothetical protein